MIDHQTFVLSLCKFPAGGSYASSIEVSNLFFVLGGKFDEL